MWKIFFVGYISHYLHHHKENTTKLSRRKLLNFRIKTISQMDFSSCNQMSAAVVGSALWILVPPLSENCNITSINAAPLCTASPLLPHDIFHAF